MKQDKKYHLFVYSFLFSIFLIGLFSWHEAHAVVFENPITAVTLQELIAVIVRGILGFLIADLAFFLAKSKK